MRICFVSGQYVFLVNKDGTGKYFFRSNLKGDLDENRLKQMMKNCQKLYGLDFECVEDDEVLKFIRKVTGCKYARC